MVKMLTYYFTKYFLPKSATSHSNNPNYIIQSAIFPKIIGVKSDNYKYLIRREISWITASDSDD